LPSGALIRNQEAFLNFIQGVKDYRQITIEEVGEILAAAWQNEEAANEC